MHEPEEPDESTPPAMRHVFDELEAEFEAGLRLEAEQESMAAVRAELGATVLWEQLARRVGMETVVHAGPRAFRGTIVASYPEFLVVRTADGAEQLIRLGRRSRSPWLPSRRRCGRRPTRPRAATSSRWPFASSPGGGSRSGCC